MRIEEQVNEVLSKFKGHDIECDDPQEIWGTPAVLIIDNTNRLNSLYLKQETLSDCRTFKDLFDEIHKN